MYHPVLPAALATVVPAARVTVLPAVLATVVLPAVLATVPPAARSNAGEVLARGGISSAVAASMLGPMKHELVAHERSGDAPSLDV